MAIAGAACAQSPPASSLGAFRVHVTSANTGAAVANATVCIGTTNSPNLFYRGTTDTQGNVRFASVPREPFVATANVSGRGTQRPFSPASANVPLLSIELALPEGAGSDPLMAAMVWPLLRSKHTTVAGATTAACR
jgi:hypothetical protein